MKTVLAKIITSAFFLLSFTVFSVWPLDARENWQALDGFTPASTEMIQVGDHYVVVPFVNHQESLMAAVFFTANCDVAGCAVERRAGYAITNAEGSDVQLYIEPRERELIALVRQFNLISLKHN